MYFRVRIDKNLKKRNSRTVKAVRLFARGLDKEMGMSGTDTFVSDWKVSCEGINLN